MYTRTYIIMIPGKEIFAFRMSKKYRIFFKRLSISQQEHGEQFQAGEDETLSHQQEPVKMNIIYFMIFIIVI